MRQQHVTPPPQSVGTVEHGSGKSDEGRVLLREPKRLYRLLDRVFAAADDRHGGRRLLAWCLREFFTEFHGDLGIQAACLYSARRDRFQLIERVGCWVHPLPDTLDGTSADLRMLAEDGVRTSGRANDRGSPQRLGITDQRPAAAMLVAEPRSQHLVLFFFDGTRGAADSAEVDFVLRTLRAVFSARVLQNRWGNSIREATEIQRGLLPRIAPTIAGFDIAGRSDPAEDVGGDLYDFLQVGTPSLGIAIADASGHGLGAALVARDISVGLRMGARDGATMPHLLSQLNRVVRDSDSGNAFVSVFYGELHPDGDFSYVNAGHPPPVLVCGSEVRSLRQGGIVLGPVPDARFERHGVHLEPGSLLVLFTDGISERQNAAGAFFDLIGVQAAVQAASSKPAAAIVDAIFDRAHAYAGGLPWEDDATVVVVKRT